VVVAFSALSLALRRAGAGRNRRDFLLRHNFTGILRERSLARLRALQANERCHAATTASRAPEVNDRPAGRVQEKRSVRQFDSFLFGGRAACKSAVANRQSPVLSRGLSSVGRAPQWHWVHDSLAQIIPRAFTPLRVERKAQSRLSHVV